MSTLLETFLNLTGLTPDQIMLLNPLYVVPVSIVFIACITVFALGFKSTSPMPPSFANVSNHSSSNKSSKSSNRSSKSSKSASSSSNNKSSNSVAQQNSSKSSNSGSKGSSNKSSKSSELEAEPIGKLLIVSKPKAVVKPLKPEIKNQDKNQVVTSDLKGSRKDEDGDVDGDNEGWIPVLSEKQKRAQKAKDEKIKSELKNKSKPVTDSPKVSKVASKKKEQVVESVPEVKDQSQDKKNLIKMQVEEWTIEDPSLAEFEDRKNPSKKVIKGSKKVNEVKKRKNSQSVDQDKEIKGQDNVKAQEIAQDKITAEIVANYDTSASKSATVSNAATSGTVTKSKKSKAKSSNGESTKSEPVVASKVTPKVMEVKNKKNKSNSENKNLTQIVNSSQLDSSASVFVPASISMNQSVVVIPSVVTTNSDPKSNSGSSAASLVAPSEVTDATISDQSEGEFKVVSRKKKNNKK